MGRFTPNNQSEACKLARHRHRSYPNYHRLVNRIPPTGRRADVPHLEPSGLQGDNAMHTHTHIHTHAHALVASKKKMVPGEGKCAHVKHAAAVITRMVLASAHLCVLCTCISETSLESYEEGDSQLNTAFISIFQTRELI